jgi:aminopeptidase N
MSIPFAVGLIGPDGRDLPLQLTGESATPSSTRILAFNQREQSFMFTGIAAKPLPSLLRNFSAPVIVDYPYTLAELVFLLTYDSDPFNRWEAGQRLAIRELLALAQAVAAGKALRVAEMVLDAFGRVLRDESLSPAFRAHVLTLPSETYLAEQMTEVDPAAVHSAWLFFRQQLASRLRDDWLTIYRTHQTSDPYDPSAVNAGRRALKNLALSYWSELDDTPAGEYAYAQYQQANNMTDRAAALSVLLLLGGTSATEALADFYRTFEQEPLVIDKWFALQATRRGAPGERVLDSVRELMHHPAFTLHNPNRARALIASFCVGNPAQFHLADGSGYAFWADQVIAIDTFNPQIAARLARALERWRKFIPALRAPMRVALERVMSHAQSKDVREIVEKTLAHK